jgi:hypothetical protein
MLNNNDDTNDFLQRSLQGLIAKHFTGINDVILNRLLTALPLEDILTRFQTEHPGIEKTEMEDINPELAKQLDIGKFMLQFDGTVQPDFLEEFTKEEAVQFGEALSAFSKEFIHAMFTYLAVENNIAAPNIQAFLKQIFSSMREESPEISEFLNQLDIDNVPLQSSIELFLKNGASLPGMSDPEYTVEATLVKEDEDKVEVEPKDVPQKIITELTENEAIFISYQLQEQHQAIKDWRPLAAVLRSSNGRDITVVNNKRKIGLLLSVIKCLYQKRTKGFGTRYLRTDRGNGIWTFFQAFLVTAPNNLVEGELRKLFNQYKNMEQAEQIVEEALDPNNRNKINERVNEILKKSK